MKINPLVWVLISFCLFSCSAPTITKYEETGVEPEIYPDYKEVTVPENIAPLNFRLKNQEGRALLYIEGENEKAKVASSDSKFIISPSVWKKLVRENKGNSIRFTIFVEQNQVWKKYKPFSIQIANESADPYLVYRLIEPGYELWETMGIYQKNIENGEELAVYENMQTNYNCVYCHSFCMQNPDQMLLHFRGDFGGTIIKNKGKIEYLDTKTNSTISSFVYPAWHPSGKFIAFSVNNIAQSFYLNNTNRLEVYDSKSDVVIFNTEKKETFTCPLLSSPNYLETFPSFSNDGKKLFFCSAKQFSVPQKSDSVKYSLCSIPFDKDHETFGQKVDTIFNARICNKSASFPRVSPDGRFLLFTVSDYGTFPIWHKEADMEMFDLKEMRLRDMTSVNSDNTESYHSWSSNSRWIVFSSRRDDGLYTRLYLSYVGNDGNPRKAFMLPQNDPDFYTSFMKSYNIPEFVTASVDLDKFKVARQLKSGTKNSVQFVSNRGFVSLNTLH